MVLISNGRSDTSNPSAETGSGAPLSSKRVELQACSNLRKGLEILAACEVPESSTSRRMVSSPRSARFHVLSAMLALSIVRIVAFAAGNWPPDEDVIVISLSRGVIAFQPARVRVTGGNELELRIW